MPPEPQPWDRTFSGRKHARSPSADAVAGGGGVSAAASHRWREPPPVPRASPRPSPRPSPRLPPPGPYRHGSGYYQGYPEESGAGRAGTPSRSGDARYPGGRSGRDGRGSFHRSPWRQSPRLPPPVTAPRSLAVSVGTVTATPSQPPVMPSQPLVKDPDDDGGAGADRVPYNLVVCKLDSHPWTRPCSLSASKSSKSELDEVVAEELVPVRMDTLIQSPVMSPAALMCDDGGPRKKPRLSWGQGLAKHEKKKVVGCPDTAGQSGTVQCDTAGQSGVTVQCDSCIMVAPDVTSPKPAALIGCASPATLGSGISSVSSVMEQNLFIKESNNNLSHPSDASGEGLQSCSPEFSIKLDPFDPNCISNLSSLITDLVQHEDGCSGDSSFMRHTAMNKLFVLKEDISKELEKTECEIDLFENELKALNGDGKTHAVHSSSVQATYSVEPCSESADITLKVPLDSDPSKFGVLVSSVALAGEPILLTHSLENGGNIKDTSVVCLGTASPKCVKPTSSVNDFHAPKLAGCLLDDDGVLRVLDGSGDDNCFDSGSSNVYADNDTITKVKDDNSLIDIIIASNKDAARKASEVLDNSLSLDHPQYNVWDSDYLLSCRKNVKRVREKLAVHTRQCNFKEKVLALKFRAFHHLWKEDRRLLVLKKNKPKAQRHLESCSQTSGNSLQIQRTSIRSRFMLPGNLTQVPTDEIVDFTRKLLLDSQIKIFRENLKMPALILDDMGKKYSRFISSNGLVEEPSIFEKERAMINPWTPEEKEIFLEMLGTLGKNFTKISSFLTHKTTADCVEFYYKNHKSECFIYVKKRLDLKKQQQFLRPNSGLVISQNKWNIEANAASHDILDESAVAAVRKNGKIRNRRRYTVRSVSGSYNDSKFTRGNNQFLDRESPVDIREKEIVAADVLAGICGALSSEAMNSSVTSSLNPAEKMKKTTTDMALTPEVPKNINEDTCSDGDCGELKSVDWSDDEKSLLIRALIMYGKNFPRISRFVGTRSMKQCKIFFSKARKCLGLDMIHPGPDMGDTLMSDMNDERSDTDNACALELDSAICSTQSCSKLDVDFTQSVENTSSERFVPNRRNIPMQSRSCEQCEVEGTNCEEVECKVDGFAPVPNDIKLLKEGENPQSDTFLEKNDNTANRCNESIQMATEFGGGITEEAGPDIGSVPVNSTITESTKAVCLKSSEQSTVVSIPQIKADNTGVSLRFIPYSNTSGDVSSSGTEVTVSSGLEFAPNYQIPVEVLPHLQKKHQIQMLDNGLRDPSSVYYEGNMHVSNQSGFNFEGQGNKRHHNLVAKDFYHPNLMGNMLNQVRHPMHILRGYPLHVFNHKEVKKIANHVNGMPVMLENGEDVNGISLANQFVCPDTNSEKNSGSQLLKSQSGILNPLKSENQLEAQLLTSAESICGELEVQSNRNGDFKLFGQIVSQPSSQQNLNPSPQECDSRSLSPKQNASVTMKLSNSQNGRTTTSRLVSSNHLDQAELPAKSYGFWDGNQIQTGYFSVPESAIMLAKCQESLSASSFCPANDCVPSGNAVLTDYQQACVQTFAADAKRLKRLPELQKRNVFETLPSLHQQGRAMLGVNVVEGGEILVGAGEGVSIPVAALKMHAGRGKLRKRKAESQRGDVEGKQ